MLCLLEAWPSLDEDGDVSAKTLRQGLCMAAGKYFNIGKYFTRITPMDRSRSGHSMVPIAHTCSDTDASHNEPIKK